MFGLGNMWLDLESQNPALKTQHTSTLPLMDAQVDLYFLPAPVFIQIPILDSTNVCGTSNLGHFKCPARDKMLYKRIIN